MYAAWPLWLLGALALIAALFGGETTRLLRYERDLILAGEWWRLWTGQLVHLGPAHLLLNLAGLGLIGWLCAPGLRPSHWWALLAGSWLAIMLGFVLLEPELAWYVGLSGLLHGLLLGGAVLGVGLPAWLRLALVVGVFLKLAWEQCAGSVPLTAQISGGAIIVDAHLYGAIGGFLGGVSVCLFRHFAVPRTR